MRKGVNGDDKQEGPGEVPTSRAPRMLFGTGRAEQGPRGPCALRCAFSPWQGSLLPVQTPRALTHLLRIRGVCCCTSRTQHSHVEVSILGNSREKAQPPCAGLYFTLYQGHSTCLFNPPSSSVDRGCHTLNPYICSGLGTAMNSGECCGRCPFNRRQPRQPGAVYSRHFLPRELNRPPEETQ